METNPTFFATLDDIVFEGRNKAYGAYVLRKRYNQHLNQAILYAIALFLVGFSIPAVATMLKEKPDTVSQVKEPPYCALPIVLQPIEMPAVQEAKPAGNPAEEAKPSAPTVKNTTIKVVEDTKSVVDEIPTQNQLETANSGLVTSESDGGGSLNSLELGTGTGTGDGVGSGTGTEDSAPSYFISVENMPEFAGGLPKLMEFVGKHLQYPRAAMTHEIEGTVIVSFVVSATGQVTDIQVLKGLGYGTEEEAIRVVKKLPRWKPGNQNGINVPVRMTLPIRLKLNK